ncbi:MAG: calcium-binding protein, partial [Sulfuricurvum sp.]|nr:calcium-binding protein [Sulfuricurvum sp.]
MAKLFGQMYTGKIGDAIDAISYTEAGSDIINRINEALIEYANSHNGHQPSINIGSVPGENGGTEPAKPLMDQTDGSLYIPKIDVTIGDFLNGVPVGQNMFATYDPSVILIHELSHVLLFLKQDKHDEDDVATLANGNSYENLYTTQSGYYKTICGLGVDTSDLQRTGYQVNGSFQDNNKNLQYPIGASAEQILKIRLDNLKTIPGTYEYAKTHSDSISYFGSQDSDLPSGSVMIDAGGTTKHYALSGATPEGGLYGGGGNDYLDGGYGDDYLEGNGGNDTLIGGGGNDILWSGEGDDRLEGGENDDILFGDTGNDLLSGGIGSDELYGGEGDDVLMGNDGYGVDDGVTDYLDGGTGFDTYVVGNGDIVTDSDGSGIIAFAGQVLSGGVNTKENPDRYISNDGAFFYDKSGNDLVVSHNNATSEAFVITDFFIHGTQNGMDTTGLNITLENVEQTTASEHGTPTTWYITGDYTQYQDWIKQYPQGQVLFNPGVIDTSRFSTDDNFVFGTNAAVGGLNLGVGFDTFAYALSGIGVNAGEGDDSINLYAGINNTIDAGDGNDRVYTGNNANVTGGSGNDIITVGDNSTAYGDGGDDYIIGGNLVYIDSGDQRDTISAGNDATILAGSGSDVVTAADRANIDAGSGNDTITTGNYATINAGSGNNSVYAGNNAQIITNDGSNTISTGGNSTITSGNGNDTITAQSDNTINAGAGNNNIKMLQRNRLTTLGGADVVTAGSDNSIITAEGADRIAAESNNNIDSGSENDTIIAVDNNTIDAGEGDNSIKANNTNTINSGSGNDSVYAKDTNTIFTAEGVDTVNAGSNNQINTAGGDDSVTAGDNNTIITAEGADSVRAGNNNSIDTGSENDTVTALNNNNIQTADGDDTIQAGDNNIINSGSGDDRLSAQSGNTISTESGNDGVVALNNNTIITAEGTDSVRAGSGNDINTGSDNDSVTVVDRNTIVTADGDDTIQAGNNNTIDTGSGYDRVVAGDNNTIVTSDGSDYINVRSGNSIDSGSGDDKIYAVDNNTIITADGIDKVEVGNGNTIDTGSENDTLKIIGNSNAIMSEEGDDILTGGGAYNVIDTGIGNDSIEFSQVFVAAYNYTMSNNQITTGEGNDSLIFTGLNSPAENNVIDTGEGDDNVEIYNIQNSTVHLGEGNNVGRFFNTNNVDIDSGNEIDTIILSHNNFGMTLLTNGGDDLIYGGLGSENILDTGSGNDILMVDYYVKGNFWSGSVSLINSEIKMGDGNDQLISGEYSEVSSNIIDMGNGTDKLKLIGNSNTINTGSENDVIQVVGNFNAIMSENGDDVLSGKGANNVIDTGTGDDFLTFSEGVGRWYENYNMSNNQINMGEGDDTIEFASYNNSYVNILTDKNIIDMGAGNDTAKIYNLFNSTVHLGEGENSGQFSYTYGINVDSGDEIDNITLSSGNVSMTLVTNGGDDTILGNDITNSEIRMGEGDDSLTTGSWGNILANTIDMGSGNDRVVITGMSTNNNIDLGDGADYLELWANGENNAFIGGSGDDDMEIYTYNQNNIYDGGEGDDVLQSHIDEQILSQGWWSSPPEGSDTYLGGDGNDTIIAQYGTNVIDGGDGNDRITIAYGRDTIEGGEGDDIIIVQSENAIHDLSYENRDYSNRDYGPPLMTLDTIITDSGGNDTLYFDNNIAREDIVFTLEQNDDLYDIVIYYGEKYQHTLRITPDSIETITMRDGSSISTETITQTVMQMALTQGYSDPYDLGLDEIINNNNLISTLYSAWNNTSITKTSQSSFDNENESIIGTNLSDHIESFSGDDTIEAGKGDDYTNGGNGNDTYIFSHGDGNDTLLDRSESITVVSMYGEDNYYGGEDNFWTYSPNYAPSNDTIILKDAISRQDLEFNWDSSSHNDLILKINPSDGVGNTDSIRIKEFYDQRFTIENIVIEGESKTLSYNDILNIMSTDNSEAIRGVDWENNTINGWGGDDAIIGGILDDTITGGTGNDYINGREGDDTYYFNIGDGVDILEDTAEDYPTLEYDSASYPDTTFQGDANYFTDKPFVINNLLSGGYDKVIFGDGITIQDVNFSLIQDGGLDINYGANYGDEIILKRQFDADASIEEFDMNDGTFITNTDLQEGIIETQDYLDENSIYLQDIQDEGRDTQGYIDQFILDKWQRVDKTLYGSEDDDIIESGHGDDTVFAGSGDDIIVGGYGNDYLDGGSGNDIYIYNRWDGIDTIVDTAGSDSVSFGNDIYLSDLIADIDMNTGTLTLALINEIDKRQTEANGDIYTPNIADLTQKLILNEWESSAARIESFSFADGTILTAMELYNHFFSTEKDDVLYGLEGDNNINSLDGNDTIQTGNGNDILNGGKGNDHLEGGSGNDTYVIGQNMGEDIIFDLSGVDTIQFADGITTNDIKVWYENNDLVVCVDGNGQTLVTLTDWYSQEHRIETFTFSDGTVLNVNDIVNLQYEEVKGVLEGTTFDVNAGDETLYIGQSSNDVYRIGKEAGDNVILDAGGLDRIEFTDGLTADMLTLTYEGDDLIIAVDGTNVRISSWYTSQNRIEIFSFENGSTLSAQNILDLMGTDGDDKIRSFNEGGHLAGGAGNDTLEGGSGDDFYLFNKGDGKDVIIDSGGVDTLYFGAGIKSSDVIINAVGEDLLLTFKYDAGKSIDEVDQITIKNWNVTDFIIESLSFSDGNEYSVAELIAKNTNQAPEAIAETTHTLQDIRIFSGEVGATDIDADILTYTISTDVSHGTLVVDENGKWSYAATDGYMGTDSAVITIDDSNGGVITQTLNFELKVSAPSLSDTSTDLFEDTSASGMLNVLNPIGGALVYEVLNTSAKGAFVIDESGNWNYNPSANINGSDSVTIKVTNAYGLSTTATLNLAIEAVNDAPILTETPAP